MEEIWWTRVLAKGAVNLLANSKLLTPAFIQLRVFWFNPSQQLSPTQMLIDTLPPSGAENQKKKAGKLVGWNEDSLIGKRSKASQGINSPLSMSRRMETSLGKQGFITCSGDLGRQTPSLWKSLLLPSAFSSFLCWAWPSMVWNIPWVNCSQLS